MALVSIQMDHQSPVPLCRQIAAAVRRQIRAGALAAGDRLPAARALARQLGVNPVTVVTAYRALHADGLVDSRPGSGTRVCRWLADLAPAAPAADVTLDLAGRQPDPALFPTAVVKRLMNHVLDTEGGRAFSYGDIGGYAPLKHEMRRRLEEDGLATAGSGLVVFSGAQQGLSLLLEHLVKPGDRVLVERPTYPGMLWLLSRAGARVEAIDLGPEGPDVDEFGRILRARPVKLFYCMPVYHNPTGICYGDDRKQAILQLCARHGVTILEDDALSDLDFGHGRYRPLRAATPEAARTCVYVKSFSQVLMPGLRLGVCLAPAALADALGAAKEQADLLTSGFFQRLLYLLARHGELSRHVRRLEAHYQPLFAEAVAAAERILVPAGFRPAATRGGTSLWVRLPDTVNPAAFLRRCARQGLALGAGAEYADDGSTEHFIALGFGHLAPDAWRSALGRVRDLALAGEATAPEPPGAAER